MPAPDKNSADNPDDILNANDLARELMMPVGEPAAAVIAACLLLGMVWVVASGHLRASAPMTHAASVLPAGPNASGTPASHRSAS